MKTNATEPISASPPPRLHVIRHGETAWSLSGQHTSRTDLELIPAGREEAAQLAARLTGVTFNWVFSSPRLRARQTCELAGLGATMEIEPDLAEWDYGDYEGKRAGEIHQLQPDWNIYRDGCPHGESPDQISARADRLIAKLRLLSGNIALVSHGHFSRVLAVRWIGLPVAAASHLMINTASLSILTSDQNRVVPAIALWNSTGTI
jgi:broad specificity phosphatase PhoE